MKANKAVENQHICRV